MVAQAPPDQAWRAALPHGRRAVRAAARQVSSLLGSLEHRVATAVRRGYTPKARTHDPAPVAAYCIYRPQNAHLVQRIVEDLPAGSTVALHSLGKPDVDLASFTRHEGPGQRIPLIQQLMADSPPESGSAVLIFDDDVLFTQPGDLDLFLRFAEAAEFDVAAPAHQWGSAVSHDLTRARTLSLARLSPFVEVGPVVWIAPRAFPSVFPFPADIGMGWGLDVHWSELSRQGLRLGIVDWTVIRHVGRVGGDYTVATEDALLARYLDVAGVSKIGEITSRPTRSWRPWQPTAPWATRSAGRE